MTREEAIAIFKGFKFLPREMEAVDMAIKALEQEPCEDCVSRQEVLAIAGDSRFDLDDCEDKEDFCAEIRALPPVTLIRKKGKWKEYPHEWGDNWQCSDYECSICYNRAHFDTDFCPNCGAEMESEE